MVMPERLMPGEEGERLGEADAQRVADAQVVHLARVAREMVGEKRMTAPTTSRPHTNSRIGAEEACR